MDVDQINGYEDFLKYIHNKPFDDLLKMTNNEVQLYVVKTMMNSFTDPEHIQMFINKFSPNDEVRETRDILWKLMR